MQPMSRLEAFRFLFEKPDWYQERSIDLQVNGDGETIRSIRRVGNKIYLVTADIYDNNNGDDFQEEISPKELLKEIRQYLDRFPLVYVNAYEVERHCYSQAEGGCFADFGQPICSVPILKKGDATDKEVERLKKLFGPDYERRHNRFSVLGGADLEVFVEGHMAAPFPKEYPHYE